MSGVLRASFVLVTLLGAGTSTADVAELEDAQARIQYGFLTSDARAIENVLQELASYEVDERLAPLKEYQLAYGYWKLAQVRAQADAADTRSRSSARVSKSAKACVEHARTARSLDERMAEAYALEAICDAMPGGFLRIAGLTGSCARSRLLRTARSLEPENPRILLIEAMCSGEKEGADGVARWQTVVDAFEASSSSRAGKPDWGETEALVMLGEHRLQRGEVLAAREALEKALILAPDYRAARELLDSAAERAR